jgi:curved DNA-binding protein
MGDYYSILGLDRSASQAQIKQAYRKLASKHHPDKGGDKELFQQIQEAYSVLGDPDKRTHYDNPQPDFGFGFGSDHPFADIFANMHQQARRNPDAVVNTRIPLEKAYTGTEVMIETPFAKELLTVHAGVRDGTRFRISGKGHSRFKDVPPGDLIVQIHVQCPANIKRDNDDVYQWVELDALDAITGTVIDFEHFAGKLMQIKVPQGSQHGGKLRLTGWGMPNPRSNSTGDLYLVLSVVVPQITDQNTLEKLNSIKQEVSKT